MYYTNTYIHIEPAGDTTPVHHVIVGLLRIAPIFHIETKKITETSGKYMFSGSCQSQKIEKNVLSVNNLI
jgi:hypothetical protein